MSPVKQAISDAKITEKDLDEVILVGGSTRIPGSQGTRSQANRWQGTEPVGKSGQVVAVGAAIQAGVLTGEVKSAAARCEPLSLGLETLGGVMTKLIERNSTIPSRKTEIFSTAADNQSAVDIHVLQVNASWLAITGRWASSGWKVLRLATRSAADRSHVLTSMPMAFSTSRRKTGNRQGAEDHNQWLNLAR